MQLQRFPQCVFIQGLMSAEGGTVTSIRMLPSSFPPQSRAPVVHPRYTHFLPPRRRVAENSEHSGSAEFVRCRPPSPPPTPLPHLFNFTLLL